MIRFLAALAVSVSLLAVPAYAQADPTQGELSIKIENIEKDVSEIRDDIKEIKDDIGSTVTWGWLFSLLGVIGAIVAGLYGGGFVRGTIEKGRKKGSG